MNAPIQVDSKDFILQSLHTIGTHIPQKDAYVLLVKSYRCHYCVQYQPMYEQFATQYPNIGFLVLEAPDNIQMLQQWGELASPAFQVNGYPTVVTYNKEGHPLSVVEDRTKLNFDISDAIMS